MHIGTSQFCILNIVKMRGVTVFRLMVKLSPYPTLPDVYYFQYEICVVVQAAQHWPSPAANGQIWDGPDRAPASTATAALSILLILRLLHYVPASTTTATIHILLLLLLLLHTVLRGPASSSAKCTLIY